MPPPDPRSEAPPRTPALAFRCAAYFDADPSDLTDDIARFVTRANCLAGIEALVYEHHGPEPHANVAVETISLVDVGKQRRLEDGARRLPRVAWQTELASRLGSAFDDPALLRVTCQTLPVNAYYALFTLTAWSG